MSKQEPLIITWEFIESVEGKGVDKSLSYLAANEGKEYDIQNHFYYLSSTLTDYGSLLALQQFYRILPRKVVDRIFLASRNRNLEPIIPFIRNRKVVKKKMKMMLFSENPETFSYRCFYPMVRDQALWERAFFFSDYHERFDIVDFLDNQEFLFKAALNEDKQLSLFVKIIRKIKDDKLLTGLYALLDDKGRECLLREVGFKFQKEKEQS